MARKIDTERSTSSQPSLSPSCVFERHDGPTLRLVQCLDVRRALGVLRGVHVQVVRASDPLLALLVVATLGLLFVKLI